MILFIYNSRKYKLICNDRKQAVTRGGRDGRKGLEQKEPFGGDGDVY